MNHQAKRAYPLGRNCKAVAVAAILSLGTVVQLDHAIAGAAPTPDAPKAKPVRAMNMALGNMVYLAKDIGFSVRNAKQENIDSAKIAARAEAQLNGLRETYRRETANNSSLLGSMTLQFTLSAKGEVSLVKDLAGRMSSTDFKKTVLAEIAKWNFTDLVAEALTVQCTLLFVQEGMDITTLARWEKSLAAAPEKVAASKTVETKEAAKPNSASTVAAPTTTTAAAATPKTAPSAKPAPVPEANKAVSPRAAGAEYQLKYATLLRKDPNFSAPVLTTFTIGTKVTIIKNDGDWLEVRATHNGPSGFIRKEFIATKATTGN